MAATQTRPYEVTTPQGLRLVEAINPTQAIRHCVVDVYSASPANGKRVAELIGGGSKYEIAGDAAETQEPLPLEGGGAPVAG